jgi:hypothetical protein
MTNLYRLAAFAVGLACASPCLQAQADSQAQTMQLLQSMVKQHEAWGPKVSSPGASIVAKEVGREGATVRYNLYVTGLPTDGLYDVLSWPVTQRTPSTVFQGVSLGKDGLVMCTGRLPNECNDPDPDDHGIVDFAFNPAKGEPIRLALAAGEQRAAIVIVPDPIAATDQGCTLSAVRLMPHFELTYLTGQGYAPNTDVTFDSESLGEKHVLKTHADDNGAIRFVMLPSVMGHSKGTIKVKGAGMKCSPALAFDWGQ